MAKNMLTLHMLARVVLMGKAQFPSWGPVTTKWPASKAYLAMPLDEYYIKFLSDLEWHSAAPPGLMMLESAGLSYAHVALPGGHQLILTSDYNIREDTNTYFAWYTPPVCYEFPEPVMLRWLEGVAS